MLVKKNIKNIMNKINTVFQSGNIKVYYPKEINDINPVYECFIKEKYNIYFDRYRKINFSIEEFESINLLLELTDKLSIFQQCKKLGLSTHIDYKNLIN